MVAAAQAAEGAGPLTGGSRPAARIRDLRRVPFFVALSIACATLAPSHAALPGTTAPVATISSQSALTGTTTVAFDANVRGVSVGNVVLRVAGTNANLPTSIRCIDDLGNAADCGLGPVSRVVVARPAPLVAGQLYTAKVNPGGADPVTDLLGNAVAYTARSFRASLTEQESSAGVTFRWRRVANSNAYGGSYYTERSAGARATMRFTGSSITWYTRTAPTQGTATVYVDGVKKGVVDNYASTSHWKVARRVSGLAAGMHRITIFVDGKRGSTRGTGANVTIDAWAPDGAIASGPDAVYRWDFTGDGSASGDQYARSNATSARATFVFRGKGIDWYTVTGPRQGKATIAIDGAVRKTVDNYSASVHHGVRRRVAGLSDAVHRVTVEVLGTRNKASKGTYVVVDKWVVRLPSAIAFRGLGTWVDLYDFGLSPSSASASMASHGVKTLYIETARYNSGSAFVYPTKIGQWVEAAHANKMRIVGWYLPAYSEHLGTDVARTAAIATYRSPKGQRFDALAIDIEYKGATGSLYEFNSGVSSHLARVRRLAGNTFPIGAITPAPLGMAISPSHWTGFPWSAIGRYADAVLPMGYWSYRTDCSSNPQHCPYGYTRGNVSKARGYTGLPVHVIGGIGNAVSASEVSDFARGARAEHAYGGSLYDYRTTASSFWSPLRTLNP